LTGLNEHWHDNQHKMNISHHFWQCYFLPSSSSSWMTFIQQRRLIIPKKWLCSLWNLFFSSKGLVFLKEIQPCSQKCQPLIKKKPPKKEKRYKMERPKFWQKEKTTNVDRPQGEHEQIKYWNLPIAKNILNKERRGTSKML